MSFPAVTMKHYLQQSVTDIVSILSEPPSTTVPSLSSGDDIHNAILDLATILNRADQIPNLPETCKTPLPRVLNDSNMQPAKDATPEVLINNNSKPIDESPTNIMPCDTTM